MRFINICAALSGALALFMLVIASHVLQGPAEDIARIQLGGFIQLTSAAAALAISNREGRLNLIAGVMILAGAGLFSAVLYALSLTHIRALAMLAPVGGICLIVGWLALAFTKPRA